MDLGPGDFIECVDASHCDYTGLQSGLVVGALYRVERIGLGARSRQPRLWCVEDAPDCGGWRISRFRPIYRPRSELIETLKTPVSIPGDVERVRQGVE